MPKEWYDFHSLIVKDSDDEETVQKKGFNKRILAEKKPYFMIYVYPPLKREYTRFCEITELNRNAQGELDSECQTDYDEWYQKKMPIFDNGSTMNRLCHHVEREFDGWLKTVKDKDYPFGELLVSENYGDNINNRSIYDKLKILYEDYRKRSKDALLQAKMNNITEDDGDTRIALKEAFLRSCEEICPSAEILGDLLLKLCYTSTTSKKFVWDICGEQIVKNLLIRNKIYSFFISAEDGEIVYRGVRYAKMEVEI